MKLGTDPLDVLNALDHVVAQVEGLEGYQHL